MALREAMTAVVVAVPFGLAVSAGAGIDEPDPVFRFEDPAIVESSGLTVLPDGRFVTVNDSGDEARVFTVDPVTGRTVGVTRWEGAVEDVESVAPDSADSVWVGDIGDNRESRSAIWAIRVPVGEGDRDVPGERVTFSYPEGPANAEALLTDPRDGRLVVVTKDVLGGTVYVAPDGTRPGSTVELEPVGSAQPLVTDGAFFPDGRHIVLRNYGRAVVYSWPELQTVGGFDIPPQQQGEGIAVDADNRVFVSSEGARAPVLEVALPERLANLVAGEPLTTPEAEEPEPSDEPTLRSREGEELPQDDDAGRRDPVPWLIGSALLLVGLVVLVRSLRPTQQDPPR
ncbi:hypothetical protein [Nocardioides sp.]|uniref:hypothetical protein n=1 Tax=Nocardioides sp. TaxID=35761 RepID=UPI002ED45925